MGDGQPPFFFQTSQMNVPYSQPTPAGIYGMTHQLMNGHGTSFPAQQQPSAPFQNGLGSPLPGLYTSSSHISGMDNTQILSNNDLSRVTKKLPEEDLQQELQEEADTLPRKRLPHHKIEKLLRTYFIVIAVANMLSLGLISSWYISRSLMVIPIVLAILICLCIGVIAESDRIKFFSWTFLLAMWACGGYICGSYFCNTFGLGASHSLEICIGFACALVAALGVGRFHLRLFYSQN